MLNVVGVCSKLLPHYARKTENAYSFASTVRPTVQSNPSRKRSFSKTLFKPEEFENVGLAFSCARQNSSASILSQIFSSSSVEYLLKTICLILGNAKENWVPLVTNSWTNQDSGLRNLLIWRMYRDYSKRSFFSIFQLPIIHSVPLNFCINYCREMLLGGLQIPKNIS